MKKKTIFKIAITFIITLVIISMSACNYIVPPPDKTPDTTAPAVSSTIPVNGTGSVATNSAITAIFSETMNPLTIITATFTLKQGDTPVSGTVSYSKVSAIFVPANHLIANTPYTVTITTGAKDFAGNALASNYTWSFTTGEAEDTTAPTVSSTIPIIATKDVAINSAITAIFSEAVDPLTVTKSAFILKQGTKSVSGTVSYSLVTAVFVPLKNFNYNTIYTATITNTVKDLAGNSLDSNYSWSFTTGVDPDILAPTVTGTIIDDGAANVPVNTKVSATFSEAMNPLTITNLTFTLKQGETPVPGVITYSLVSVVFIPVKHLDYSTVYTATITTGVKDLAGNAMAASYKWSFTTGHDPDIIAPVVIGTIHENGAIDVPINTRVGATFSEAMDPLTITNLTFTLKQGGRTVPGIITYSVVSVVFIPVDDLAYNTVYTVTITTGVKDLAGNTLAAPYVLSWTTGMAPDTTAPGVISTIPVDGATGVAANSGITVVFSEMLDPLTVTNIMFTLKWGMTPVYGTVTYAGFTATFKPSSRLAAGADYTATLAMGIKDLAGNHLTSDFVWSFTTTGLEIHPQGSTEAANFLVIPDSSECYNTGHAILANESRGFFLTRKLYGNWLTDRLIKAGILSTRLPWTTRINCQGDGIRGQA